MTTLRTLFLLTLTFFLGACHSVARPVSLDRTGTRVNSIVIESPSGGAHGEIWSLSDVDQKTFDVSTKAPVSLFDRQIWLGSFRIQEDRIAFINAQLSPTKDWKNARHQPLPGDGAIRLATILGPDAALSPQDRDIQLITRYLDPLRRMKTENTTTEALAGSDNRTFITWSTLGGNRFKIRMVTFLKQTGMIREFFFRNDQLIAAHTQFCTRTGDPSVIDDASLITTFSLDRYYKDGVILHSFILPGIPQLGMPEEPAATQPAEDILNQPDNNVALATWLIQHWAQDQLNLETWDK